MTFASATSYFPSADQFTESSVGATARGGDGWCDVDAQPVTSQACANADDTVIAPAQMKWTTIRFISTAGSGCPVGAQQPQVVGQPSRTRHEGLQAPRPVEWHPAFSNLSSG